MTDTEDTDDDVPRTAAGASKGNKKTDGKKKPRLRVVPDEPPPKEDPADYKTIPALRDFVDRIANGREVVQRNFLSVAVLKDREAGDQGYRPAWTTIRWRRDGTITSRDHEPPTEAEQKAICDAFAKIADKIPRSIPTTKAAAETKRLEVGAIRENWHVILDRSRKDAVMCQQRVDEEDGGKRYIPWTFWSDGRWYCMEPDALLPPWKPEKDRKKARIMIHEGAKAARYVDHLLHDVGIAADQARAAHPLTAELFLYEHWGWIGGADRPEATDWSAVLAEKPIEIVIVCDNDAPGIAAAPRIAKLLPKSVLSMVRFDNRFKLSHDLANDISDRSLPKFWKKGRYVGPTLANLTFPATWMTDVIPSKTKGRPAHRLRPEAAAEWFRASTPSVFIHKRHPDRLLLADQFNIQVGPFSDVQDTARLFIDHHASLVDTLAYLPGEEPGLVIRDTGLRSINTHRPSSVVPIDGPPDRWLDFVEKLIPGEGDRKELLRWCATLIALPAVRIKYAVLLVSKTQGVGKGTLAYILSMLVGRHNTSWPTSTTIADSAFNGWVAHKRLAVIDEMYTGRSRKAYDRFKSIITEDEATINRKNVEEYTTDNYVHILASSNSMRALHIDDDDRRWFVPRVTEKLQEQEYWIDLRSWLAVGGLGIILSWARKFVEDDPGAAIVTGAHAPDSGRKKDVITESRAAGQDYAIEFAALVLALEEPTVISVNSFREAVAIRRERDRTLNHLEGASTLRDALEAGGLLPPERGEKEDRTQRFRVNGELSYVLANFLIEAGVSWEELKKHYVEAATLWPLPPQRSF